MKDLTPFDLRTWTLGNMGTVHNQCFSQPLTGLGLQINCPHGYIESIVEDRLGINEQGSDVSDACLVRDFYRNKPCSDKLK